MNSISPTFSIIMTSFNYETYIGAAIESVLAQTFQDWELLIVDDCSTDDSWGIIQSFDDPRIKAHKHTVNQGACAAYNYALSMAQGSYIAGLDSDDLFMPTKLERQAAFLAGHPEIGVCGTFVTEIDHNGFIPSGEAPHADWFNVLVDLNDPASWIWENRLCHSGAVVHAELHSRLGEFDKTLVYTPDWQFWIRALVAGARFAVIDQPLVGYRYHGGNITHKNSEKAVLEHAATSASILLPWLEQQGRIDLIDKTIQGFISNPVIASISDLQTRIAECLFSGSAAIMTGAAIMRQAIQRHDDLLAKESHLAEVLKGKDFLESERRSLQADLLVKESHLAEALKGKDYLESERRSLQADLLVKESHLAEVLKGKDYLESERNSLKTDLLVKESHLAKVLKDNASLQSQLQVCRTEQIEMQKNNEWAESQLRDKSVRLEHLQSALPVRLMKKIGVISDV